MDKQKYIDISSNTVDISRKGSYKIHGKNIIIKKDIEESINNTKLYIDDNIQIKKDDDKNCVIEFTNETTLQAAKRISSSCNIIPTVLNFASAKKPGGGFLTGSMAQEESIARVSTLYVSLLKYYNEFYQYHINKQNPFYTNRIIYSPDVLVIKDDNYNLYESPYKINVITSPAVNAGIIKEKKPKEVDNINNVMEERIRKIIKVAIDNNDNMLVLGAFGCGVFKNKTEDIANIFYKILITENYQRYFDKIIFAIYDKNKNNPTLNTFKNNFR